MSSLRCLEINDIDGVPLNEAVDFSLMTNDTITKHESDKDRCCEDLVPTCQHDASESSRGLGCLFLARRLLKWWNCWCQVVTLVPTRKSDFHRVFCTNTSLEITAVSPDLEALGYPLSMLVQSGAEFLRDSRKADNSLNGSTLFVRKDLIRILTALLRGSLPGRSFIRLLDVTVNG
eukprot:jgi/Psemu1/4381/gm1.4381_g